MNTTILPSSSAALDRGREADGQAGRSDSQREAVVDRSISAVSPSTE